jgi:hypothetical protein
MNIDSIINFFNEHNYISYVLYNINNHLAYIKLQSIEQCRPFLLQIPVSSGVINTNSDHQLELIENDYKNYSQQIFLKAIPIDDLACISDKNITIKNTKTYINYLIDPLIKQSTDVIDTDDIEVDEYSIKDICPVFSIKFFMDKLQNNTGNDIEILLSDKYNCINNSEEEINQRDVEILMEKIDNQKIIIKDTLFNIHKECFNIRRDLINQSSILKRVKNLKNKSSKEKDLVKFNIDRLSVETEAKIDSLNNALCIKRELANSILRNYNNYLIKFPNNF